MPIRGRYLAGFGYSFMHKVANGLLFYLHCARVKGGNEGVGGHQRELVIMWLVWEKKVVAI